MADISLLPSSPHFGLLSDFQHIVHFSTRTRRTHPDQERAMSDNSFEGSQAFNRISNAYEDVIPNSGSLILNIPIVSMLGVQDGIGLSIQLSYSMGASGTLGLPDNWSFGIPSLVPGESLSINGMRYIIDPNWMDSTGYASGLKYENNHGIAFVNNISGQTLPYGQSGATYQFSYSDTGGFSYYFDPSGNLLMQADRHGNFIYYTYLNGNLLDTITDSFGQDTTFGYNPGQIIITCPDGSTTTLNFSNSGISSLIDPLGHTTNFTNNLQYNFNVATAIAYPSGKTTNIAYTSMSFQDPSGNVYQIPAVSDLYYMDQNNNTLAHYQYAYGTQTGGNTFTGYQGGYVLSSDADGLLDSNNTLYQYNVEVRNLNAAGNTILSLTDTFYSFAHVPVQQNTYVIEADGTQTGYLQVNSIYDIAPDQHNQQPNYLSPKQSEQFYFQSATANGIPQKKWVLEYDYFGNTTSKQSSCYSLATASYVINTVELATYFTTGMQISTLIDTSTKTDSITNQVIQTANTLTADSKDIASSTVTYSNDGGNNWNNWKARNVVFDTYGREISETFGWVKTGAPGVQQTSSKYAYAYDPVKLTVTTTITDALGFNSSHAVSIMVGKKVADTLPSGATTSYVYDLVGRVLSMALPSGLQTTYAYKLFGIDGENSTTTTSPLGYQTKSVSDPLAREIANYDNGNPGNSQQLRLLSTKQYDMLSNVIAQTDVFGNTTTSVYNSLAKPTQTIDPLSNQTDVSYDFSGNKATTTVNRIPQKLVVTDNFGRTILEEKYPNTKNADASTQYTMRRASAYGGFGNLLSQSVSRVDAGVATALYSDAYAYDAEAQRISDQFNAADGSSSLTQTVYDLNQKEISHTKNVTYPDKKTYAYQSDICQYDALGQATSITNNLNQTEAYAYNGDGFMVSKTLFDASVISYQYTVDGQKSGESWVENGQTLSITYAYDKDGHLTSSSDKNGAVTNSYTLDGVLTAIVYPDGKKLSYTLDQYSRKIGQLDVSGASTSYAYSAQNLLASVTNAHDSLVYSYYQDTSQNTIFGAPKSVTLSSKYTETYQYDAQDRKNKTQKLSVAGAVILNEIAAYDPLNRLSASTLASSLSSDITLNQQRAYSYDGFSQLSSDITKNAAGTVVTDDVFQYDGNANVLTKTSNGVATAYTYNNIDQLTAYQVGAGQQQTQTYDTNGRLTIDGDGNTYSYDGRGRLSKVEGTGNTKYAYYANDLLATRLSKTSSVAMYYDNLQQMVNTYQGSTATQFLLVGSNRYASYSGSNAPYYYGTNQHQDTVLGLSATGTALVGSADYQAYGEQADGNLGLDATNNFAWNQEYKDADNQLVYLRARYYDPKTMRFISRDNTRLDNRYAFGNGDPINNIDPTGNDAVTYAAIGVGVGVGVTLTAAAIYAGITWGAAAAAAVGGTGVAVGIGAGVLAGAGALALGAGAGVAGVAAGSVALATAAVVGIAGVAEVASVGGAVGASIGLGLGAYVGATIAGTEGAVIGGAIGGVVGGIAGTAAEGAAGYIGATVAGTAASVSETAVAAASAVASAAGDAIAAAAAAVGIETAGDAAFALLGLLAIVLL
jgi:RHS repeat-associated protein